MSKSIFRAVIGGLVLGSIFYFAPFFLIPMFFFFGFMKMMFFGRMRRRFGSPQMAMDKIRNMSDEDYQAFKSQKHCGRHRA